MGGDWGDLALNICIHSRMRLPQPLRQSHHTICNDFTDLPIKQWHFYSQSDQGKAKAGEKERSEASEHSRFFKRLSINYALFLSHTLPDLPGRDIGLAGNASCKFRNRARLPIQWSGHTTPLLQHW